MHLVMLVALAACCWSSNALEDAAEGSAEGDRKAQAPPWSLIHLTPLEDGSQPRSLEAPSDGPAVAQYAGTSCSQSASCEFFNDVLLVIKLNPVRLLWLDLLLNFYSTAFKNIVFYSALRKGDTSTNKWLRIGSRRVLVRLLDDNYGFCDHYTLADAARRWPHFSGYFFLSDDVLLLFWSLLVFDKHSMWKQKPSFNPKSDKIDAGTLAAIEELAAKYPTLGISKTAHIFAPTSGCYYVPNLPGLMAKFHDVSSTLLKHRSYNEWGTPLLLDLVEKMYTAKVGPSDFPVLGSASTKPYDTLQSLEEKPKLNVVFLRGKLLWGWKRVLVKKMLSRAYSWYHPVRASGELFTRLQLLLRDKQMMPESKVDVELFTNRCLNCATFPKAWRQTKGLLHGCVEARRADRCVHNDTAWLWPQVPQAGLIGGRVFVPTSRRDAETPLELPHEGFWGKNITIYVFEEYYKLLNRTAHDGVLLRPYPQCCQEPQ